VTRQRGLYGDTTISTLPSWGAGSGGASGSGIGLTIGRAMVAGHHGRITVHSDGVGQGTEVHTTLPGGG
jgi:signal transduction histidine kinase